MSIDRKFRFGVAASSQHESASSWLEMARKAEGLGYSTLLLADHMGRQPAPLIASMAALSVTTRLRLGTQVLANPFRNPAILAKEIASLDYFSDGRFELGIGVGWPSTSNTGRSDSEQTGIDLGPSGERVERLGEAVQIIKLFFSSEDPVEFTGKHFSVKGLIPAPRAIQRACPPIMVAGAGPRLMRLAAREADIINIAPRPPITGQTPSGLVGFGMTMADEISLIKEAAGTRYDDIEICVFSFNPAGENPTVTDHPGPLIDKLAAVLNTTREAALDMPATLIGSVDSIVERIEMGRELYDISYRTIPAQAMDAFAPVVARLAGT